MLALEKTSPPPQPPSVTPWEEWAIVDGVFYFQYLMGQLHVSFFRSIWKEHEAWRSKALWKEFFGEFQAGPFNINCIGRGLLDNFCLGPQPSPWLATRSGLQFDRWGLESSVRLTRLR
jgi:hypothetical protein